MHQQTDGNEELVRLAKKVGIYVGVFLAGGAITFAYSYSPLHDAKNWKIDYLEERLEAKDVLLREVQEELAAVRADSADKPDGQTFKLLQDELVTVDKTVKELERSLAKAEKRAKDLEKSRDSLKAKLAAAQTRQHAVAVREPAPPAPSVEPRTSSASGTAPPASPAPGAPATHEDEAGRLATPSEAALATGEPPTR